jgi:flagellar motor switch protein FliN/FliY
VNQTNAPTLLADAVFAAAEAASATLPAGGAWAVRAAPLEPGEAPAAPGADARAVTAPFGDFGLLVLAASAPLAASVGQVAEDVLEGLRPALQAAATALAAGLGVEASLDEPVTVDAAGALRPAAGERVVAVMVFDGEDHAATLALIDRPPLAPAVADHEFGVITEASSASTGRSGPIELLHEVEMGVTVELGRTRMLVRDILELSPGSVIELDRAAGSPIDVLVNGTLIARGEVVVIDEEFGIRITEVIGYDEGRAR